MKLISEKPQSTVVSKYEYKPSPRTAYQSEAQLEDALIEQLKAQRYEYYRDKLLTFPMAEK